MGALESVGEPHDRSRLPVARDHSRVGLIVAGMHRSGTSALTRVLNLIGADIGSHLIDADGHNQKGYWENSTIIDLNERILSSVGLTWNSWESIDPEWFSGPRAAVFRDEAVDVLKAEFSGAGSFVIKDPRICRLLPLWINAFKAIDVTPCVLMPIRRPADVAASLFVRNQLNPSLMQLVWLRHLLDSEFYSRPFFRTFLRYDDLLGDWRGVIGRVSEAFGGFVWSRRSAAVEMDVDEFLSRKLRHHDKDADNAAGIVDFSPWVRETWRILARWSAGHIDEIDQARLDCIREALGAAERNFSRVILEHQRHGIVLAGQLEEHKNQNRDFEERNLDFEEQNRGLEERNRDFEERIASLNNEQLKLKNEQLKSKNDITRLRKERDARFEIERNLESTIEGLRAHLADVNARALDLESELAAARADRFLFSEARRVIARQAHDYDRLNHSVGLLRRLNSGTAI